jgi:hypothetical protein
LKRTLTTPAGAESYWSARFDKGDAGSAQEVNWAWSADGTWVAAANPRLDFAGHGVLYKFYATRSLRATGTTSSGAAETDPVHDFLTEFLPVLRTALDPG